MHRVAMELSDGVTPQIASRIAGVLLIADGDAVSRDKVQRFGTALKTARGIGTYAWARPFSDSGTRAFSTGFGARVFSVCNARDMVCDSSGSPITDALLGLPIHKRYTNSPELVAATDAVAQVAMNWAVPSPRTQAIARSAGTTLDSQLGVSVRVGAKVEWRPVSGLPPGISLSSTGRLTGTVPTAGQYRTRYQVRAAKSGLFSQWVTGEINWTITNGQALNPTLFGRPFSTVPVDATVALNPSTPCPAETRWVSIMQLNARDFGHGSMIDLAERPWDWVYRIPTTLGDSNLRVECQGESSTLLQAYETSLTVTSELGYKVSPSDYGSGDAVTIHALDACPVPQGVAGKMYVHAYGLLEDSRAEHVSYGEAPLDSSGLAVVALTLPPEAHQVYFRVYCRAKTESGEVEYRLMG